MSNLTDDEVRKNVFMRLCDLARNVYDYSWSEVSQDLFGWGGDRTASAYYTRTKNGERKPPTVARVRRGIRALYEVVENAPHPLLVFYHQRFVAGREEEGEEEEERSEEQEQEQEHTQQHRYTDGDPTYSDEELRARLESSSSGLSLAQFRDFLETTHELLTLGIPLEYIASGAGYSQDHGLRHILDGTHVPNIARYRSLKASLRKNASLGIVAARFRDGADDGPVREYSSPDERIEQIMERAHDGAPIAPSDAEFLIQEYERALAESDRLREQVPPEDYQRLSVRYEGVMHAVRDIFPREIQWRLFDREKEYVRAHDTGSEVEPLSAHETFKVALLPGG